MASKRSKTLAQRAARRRAERTLVNATARSAAVEAERELPPPKQARHARMVDLLLHRGSIDREQHAAAQRFERDFIFSGAVLGNLVGSYTHEFRAKKRRGLMQRPDTEAGIEARARLETAIAAAGPLAEILIATIIYDEPVARWAQLNGFRADDGVGALRFGLSALVTFYSGRRPAAMRLAPPKVPADLRPPEPEPPVDHDGGTYRDFLDAQNLDAAVDDRRLRSALVFARARGWLDDDAHEMHGVALRLARLAAARWGDELPEHVPDGRGAYERRLESEKAATEGGLG